MHFLEWKKGQPRNLVRRMVKTKTWGTKERIKKSIGVGEKNEKSLAHVGPGKGRSKRKKEKLRQKRKKKLHIFVRQAGDEEAPVIYTHSTGGI